MKVYLTPPATMSRAMFRVATALEKFAPSWVESVDSAAKADLQVLHVIGEDALTYESESPETVVIQYCMTGHDPEFWYPLWRRAQFVWSYYDLDIPSDVTRFYHAPLGVDAAFGHGSRVKRTIGILTSGYVNGPGAEAIEEPALAGWTLGLPVVHIGPVPSGLTRPMPPSWRSFQGITDAQLANLYQRAQWVSGLRYDEGFELPAVEGLACGARPIVFDRDDMRQWYQGHAIFVPQCSGLELCGRLVEIMGVPPEPVSEAEHAQVLKRFDWPTIVAGFWVHLKGD